MMGVRVLPGQKDPPRKRKRGGTGFLRDEKKPAVTRKEKKGRNLAGGVRQY